VELKTQAKAREQAPDQVEEEAEPRSRGRGRRDQRDRRERRRVRLDDDYDDYDDFDDNDGEYRDDYEYEPVWDPRSQGRGRRRDGRAPRHPPGSPNQVPPYSEAGPQPGYQPTLRDPRPDTVITATLDSISRNLGHLNRKMTRLERKRKIDTPPLPPLPPIYRYLDVPADTSDPAYAPPDDPFTLEQMAEELEMLTPPWARPREALPEPKPTSPGEDLSRSLAEHQQLQLGAPEPDEPQEAQPPAPPREALPEPEPEPEEAETVVEVTETVTSQAMAPPPEFPQELEESYQKELAEAQAQQDAAEPTSDAEPDDGIFMPGAMGAPKGDLDSLRAQLEAGESAAPVQPEPPAQSEPEPQPQPPAEPQAVEPQAAAPEPAAAEPVQSAEPDDGIFMPGSMGGPKGDLNGLRAQLESASDSPSESPSESPPVNQSQEGPPASKEAKPPEANGAAQEYPEDGIIMPGSSGNSSGGSDTSTNGPSKKNSNGGSASSLNGNPQTNGNPNPNGNSNGNPGGNPGHNNPGSKGNPNGGSNPNGANAHNNPSANPHSDPNSNASGNPGHNNPGHNNPGNPTSQPASSNPGPSSNPGAYDPSTSPSSPHSPYPPSSPDPAYPSPYPSPQVAQNPAPTSHLPPDIPSYEDQQYMGCMTYPGTCQEYYEPVDEVDSFIQALRSSGRPLNLDNARPVERPKQRETKRLPAPPVRRTVKTPVMERRALPEPEPEPELEPEVRPQVRTRRTRREEPLEEEDDLAAFEAQMSTSRRRPRPHVPAEVEFDYQDPEEAELEDEYDYEDDMYADEDELQAPDEEVNLPPWKSQFDFLWVGAVIMFGVGDVVSTWWAIQNGAQEANPFLHNIVHGNFMVFILIKVILLGVAFLYSYVFLMENGHDARFMPAVFILAGAYLVVNNYQVTQSLIEANGGSGGFSSLILSYLKL